VVTAAVFAFVVAVVYIADRELGRYEGDRALRIVVWALGLVTIGAVTLAVSHERRLARRVAERSAELERLSAELLRANRAKSEFLANVSHELRTPLNAIVGFVDLMRDGVYGELSPRQVAPVDRIEASASHLRHLVDQILDLAKMTAGRLEVHTEPFDLRPFILEVATEVEPLANERGLILSLAVGPALPRLRTDPMHLRQVLVNLLGNAVKYTPEGGITLRARVVPDADVPTSIHRPTPVATRIVDSPVARAGTPNGAGGWVAIQVSDTGIGIAREDQERIFEEFEQVNAGPRGDSMRRGTGLGLAISRRLARLLGGDITLESELGKGSTFSVWLPVDRVDMRTPGGSVVPVGDESPELVQGSPA
jgi:signal transduction histidine kinase